MRLFCSWSPTICCNYFSDMVPYVVVYGNEKSDKDKKRR